MEFNFENTLQCIENKLVVLHMCAITLGRFFYSNGGGHGENRDMRFCHVTINKIDIKSAFNDHQYSFYNYIFSFHIRQSFQRFAIAFIMILVIPYKNRK